MPKKLTTNSKARLDARQDKKPTVKVVRAQKVAANTKASTIKRASTASSSKLSEAGVRVDLFDAKGSKDLSMVLPAVMFGVTPNKKLVAQALRVYAANQRRGTASSKTRGEVRGSTRKIYRQKGTGRARHGGIRAPIFVGGGIVFGPKPRDFGLKLSKNMRRNAFFSALSEKLTQGHIKIVTGMSALQPKTKEFARCLDALSVEKNSGQTLLLVAKSAKTVTQGARNLKAITITYPSTINIFDVMRNNTLVFMKEAVLELIEHFKRN